jgi:hypothetical protein
MLGGFSLSPGVRAPALADPVDVLTNKLQLDLNGQTVEHAKECYHILASKGSNYGNSAAVAAVSIHLASKR